MPRSRSLALAEGTRRERVSRSIEPGVQSSERLLDATAELLGERSAIDVSLSEIAQRSGLNSALVKYYFGNKEGLLLALLKRDAERAMGALDHLLAMQVAAPQKLKIHISGIINAYFRSPYLNRLIHHMIESGEPESSRAVTSMFVEPMLAAYKAIVDQGVAEGSLRPTDPALLYFSLVGACDHIFHAAYSVRFALGEAQITEDIKQRYIGHVTEIYLNGLIVPRKA